MGRRWAGRTDLNHREIRDGLRKFGARVADTSSVGLGFPDLVVGYGGETDLLEVKSRANRKVGGKSQRGTNDRQQKFRDRWRGSPVFVVESLDEAIEVLTRRRN